MKPDSTAFLFDLCAVFFEPLDFLSCDQEWNAWTCPTETTEWEWRDGEQSNDCAFLASYLRTKSSTSEELDCWDQIGLSDEIFNLRAKQYKMRRARRETYKWVAHHDWFWGCILQLHSTQLPWQRFVPKDLVCTVSIRGCILFQIFRHLCDEGKYPKLKRVLSGVWRSMHQKLEHMLPGDRRSLNESKAHACVRRAEIFVLSWSKKHCIFHFGKSKIDLDAPLSWPDINLEFMICLQANECTYTWELDTQGCATLCIRMREARFTMTVSADQDKCACEAHSFLCAQLEGHR